MPTGKVVLRTSSFSLKFANREKRNQLHLFLDEYVSVVNFYIEKLWKAQIVSGVYAPTNILVLSTSWLSVRAKACAGRQALHIIKTQVKKNSVTFPVLHKKSAEFDSRFFYFLNLGNSYDEFVRFWSLGNDMIVACPIKHHAHYNKLISSGFKRKSSAILRENVKGNLYLDVFLEKKIVARNSLRTLGVDMGIKKLMVDSDGWEYGKDVERLMEKIQRKKDGSKAFKRVLVERNQYINKVVKELPECNHVLENLKGVGKNTKKRMGKKFRSKFCRWTYGALTRRIQLRDEVVGVQCHFVSPTFTSQTCSACGFIHKSNRVGEVFLCGNCGHTEDADFNASKNILNRFLTQVPIVPVSTKAEVSV